MNFRSFIACAGIMFQVGCTATFHLYPVQGPITERNPVPVIEAHIQGPGSGPVSLVLPDGETCQGQWAPNVAIAQSHGTQSTTGSVGMDIPRVWDDIFGPGYYVAKVVGERNHGQAILTGVKGTVIQLDFLHDLPGIAAIGVAKDDKGNIYKLAL